jgi:hypothetical protein
MVSTELRLCGRPTMHGAGRMPCWTVVADVPAEPAVFSLSQSHPNPFDPRTTISSTLPEWTHVMLAVLTVTGGRVAAPVGEVCGGGPFTEALNVTNLRSGLRLNAGHDTPIMVAGPREIVNPSMWSQHAEELRVPPPGYP